MKTRTREIAKAGIYGSKDDPQIVTEHDLKEIAETFGEIKTAPITFGHWSSAASPRLGNVVSVSYNPKTKSLTAELEEDDLLAAAVDAGYYPDVSIRSKQRASDGKMYLMHLAYLGQESPAIKDLEKSVQGQLGIAASEGSGVKAFPSPSGKQLYLSDTPPENFLRSEDTENPHEEDSSMTEEEARKLREENERLKAENQRKDLALSDAEKRGREADRDRLKAAMDARQVPRGIQAKALRLCLSLENGKTIELSDADAPEGKRDVTPADCLIEIITALPKPVQTGVLNLSDGEGPQPDTARVDFGKI